MTKRTQRSTLPTEADLECRRHWQMYSDGSLCRCVTAGAPSHAPVTVAPTCIRVWDKIQDNAYCSPSTRTGIAESGMNVSECMTATEAEPLCRSPDSQMYINGLVVGQELDVTDVNKSITVNDRKWIGRFRILPTLRCPFHKSADFPDKGTGFVHRKRLTWETLRHGAYCSPAVRKNLADSGMNASECMAATEADAECRSPDWQMHTDGDVCRCVRVGHQCDFLVDDTTTVYGGVCPPTGAPTMAPYKAHSPSRAPETTAPTCARQWQILRGHSYCSKGRLSLANEGMGVRDCMSAAEAEPQCRQPDSQIGTISVVLWFCANICPIFRTES
eukprot:gene57417-biopygen28312